MGSIKGFIDWVKGSELEDDYEERCPVRETKNLRWIASHHLTIEDPMTVRTTVMHRTRLRCAVTIAAIRL